MEISKNDLQSPDPSTTLNGGWDMFNAAPDYDVDLPGVPVTATRKPGNWNKFDLVGTDNESEVQLQAQALVIQFRNEIPSLPYTLAMEDQMTAAQ